MKKNWFLAAAMFVTLAVVTFVSCNDGIDDDVAPTDALYVLSDAVSESDSFDYKHVKGIRIYFRWGGRTEGELRFYSKDAADKDVVAKVNENAEKDGKKLADSYFEDLPFDDFGIDKYGNCVRWFWTKTESWTGNPIDLYFTKNVDFTKLGRIGLTYTMEFTKRSSTPDHLGINLIDKDGNESGELYALKPDYKTELFKTESEN